MNEEPLAKNSSPERVNPGNPLRGATNRNMVYRSDDGSILYKMHNAREVENYRTIDRFRTELELRGVVFPSLQLVTPATQGEPAYIGISHIDDFNAYDIAEHFGRTTNSLPHALRFEKFLDALDTIEHVIPATEFNDIDEEIDPHFTLAVTSVVGSVLPYLSSIASEQEILSLFSESQSAIVNLPRVAQHKDANPSNWRIIKNADGISVNMVDLETLGLARRGWDEGRTFALCCLDLSEQEALLSAMSERPSYQTREQQMYFWRVVLFRSIRELYLLHSNKYKEPLVEYAKEHPGSIIGLEIERGLQQTAARACSELRKRIAQSV